MKQFCALLAAFLVAAVAGVAVHQGALSGDGFQFLLSKEAEAPTPLVNRPPLEVIAEAANEIVRVAQTSASDSTSEQAADLLNDIESAYAALQHSDVSAADLSRAQHSFLIARYVGVTIDRTRFAAPFHDFAQQATSGNPDSPLARQAEMMQVLARHDLSHPKASALLADIRAFAAKHSSMQGASLYYLASQELVRRDQAAAAKSLIRQGIKDYQSTPAVVSMLVNQSAELELSKAAKPTITQADYDAMMCSYEYRAHAGASKGAASSGSQRRT